jgi:hypothetical protein
VNPNSGDRYYPITASSYYTPNTPLTPSLHRTEVSKFLGNLILLLMAKFSFEMQPEKMRHLDEGRIVQSPHTHDAR